MSKRLNDFTEEEIAAVVEYFGLADQALTSDTKLELMNSYGGAWTVLGVRMAKLGIAIGESPHLKPLKQRLEKWLGDPR